MEPNVLSAVGQLSNVALLARVKSLAQDERQATAALIAHLAELEERRLYLAEGCSSLFTYCTQILHLSEHAAHGRIEAARAVRRFPVLLDMLEDGSVNLTTVCLIASQLTVENHGELLDMIRHRSKRQVEELLARLRPQPPVPASIRRLPTVGHGAAAIPADATASLDLAGEGPSGVPVGSVTATRSGPSSISAMPNLRSPAPT
jgi:hypothetical protein